MVVAMADSKTVVRLTPGTWLAAGRNANEVMAAVALEIIQCLPPDWTLLYVGDDLLWLTREVKPSSKAEIMVRSSPDGITLWVRRRWRWQEHKTAIWEYADPRWPEELLETVRWRVRRRYRWWCLWLR